MLDSLIAQNPTKSVTLRDGAGCTGTVSRELLNRYTVNPVSWVRIPSPPPPNYLSLLIYMSLRLSQKSPRVSGALRVPRGRCGRQRRLSDRRCAATPPFSLLAIVGVPFGNQLAVRSWASAWRASASCSCNNRQQAEDRPRCESRPSKISRTRESGAAAAR